MRIIDNVNDLLGDDLKAEITTGSKVRIAASTFSIFAFEALRTELNQVSELEFIFTSPSFVTAKVTDTFFYGHRVLAAGALTTPHPAGATWTDQ